MVTWSYDPIYRLTNEQRGGPNSYNVSYAYDAVGNRTLMLNGGAPTTSTCITWLTNSRPRPRLVRA